MPIPVKCQVCGATHQVSEKMAGQKAKCRCGGVISIPTADQIPTPQQQAVPANSAFAGLADDEMDDLFGPAAGQAPVQTEAGSAEPDKSAPPPNLVGADGAGKKQTVDPNLPTPQERGKAIWGIIASAIAIPFGLVIGIIKVITVIKSASGPGEFSPILLVVDLVCLLGGFGMLIAGIGVLVACSGELKGNFPQNDQIFQLGTFACVGVIAMMTLDFFMDPVDQFVEGQAEAKAKMEEGLTFKQKQGLEVDQAPLVRQFMFGTLLAALFAVLISIIPALFLHACRSHKFRRFEKKNEFG